MHITLATLFCLTLLPAVPSRAQEVSAISKDESDVREVVSRYVEARERIDADGVAALFTPDADQLVSSGEWRKGRDEVVRGAMASSRNAAGKRSITLTSVRFVAPGVAIADGRYEIAEQTGAARRMWATLVLKKGRGGWRITAIRNMLPAEPAPSR